MDTDDKTHETVKEFLQDVGRKEFRTDLELTEQVISRAVVSNAMPSHWYLGVRAWCEERGHSVPEHLFKWLHDPALVKQDAKSETLTQGEVE